MITLVKAMFKIQENGGKKLVTYKKSLSIEIIRVKVTRILKLLMMKFYKIFGVKYR